MNRRIACALASAVVLAGGAHGAAAADAFVRVDPHEAEFGAWIVRCNQCNSFEESVCYVWQETGPASLYLYPFAAEPGPDTALTMEYAPSRTLTLDTEGVLTATVDGAVAAEIASPDVSYQAMYDDLVVTEEATMALVPALRGGEALTLSFTDPDGTGSDDFSLAGLAEALDDMAAQLPLRRPTLEEWEQAGCSG